MREYSSWPFILEMARKPVGTHYKNFRFRWVLTVLLSSFEVFVKKAAVLKSKHWLLQKNSQKYLLDILSIIDRTMSPMINTFFNAMIAAEQTFLNIIHRKFTYFKEEIKISLHLPPLFLSFVDLMSIHSLFFCQKSFCLMSYNFI